MRQDRAQCRLAEIHRRTRYEHVLLVDPIMLVEDHVEKADLHRTHSTRDLASGCDPL